MTQNELAEGLGISQHHISEMENALFAMRLALFFKTDYPLFLLPDQAVWTISE